MNGLILKKIRKEKHLTQAQLAEMLNVDTSLIGKWEIYNVMPSSDTLIKLCEILECSVDYLLTGKETTVINTNSNIANGDNNRAFVTIHNGGVHQRELTEIEDELLRVCSILDMKSKNKLLSFAYELEAQQKEEV